MEYSKQFNPCFCGIYSQRAFFIRLCISYIYSQFDNHFSCFFKKMYLYILQWYNNI